MAWAREDGLFDEVKAAVDEIGCQRRWHFGQKKLERPACRIARMGVEQEGHGVPSFPYTRCVSWAFPEDPSRCLKSLSVDPPFSIARDKMALID